MMYTIEYSKEADKTLRKWKKSNPNLFKYRSLLRIHPARNDGTQGCIGLRGNNYELQTIEKILKVSLDSNKTIPLNVIVNGY
jgi:mRNA-degrading endonuclease RelE of RelBE toxin-antitoxin system